MLIRGGTVVTAESERIADVLVRDGRVAEVGPDIAPDGDVIDAREQGLSYSAWIFARCTISRMRARPSRVHCVTISGFEPIGSRP